MVGLYHDGDQVGFSRTLSDGYSQSYLADVYVLDEHRGRGLGVELVRFSVDEGPLADTKWYLHTRDAHDLYRKFGFRRARPQSARASDQLMSVLFVADDAGSGRSQTPLSAVSLRA